MTGRQRAEITSFPLKGCILGRGSKQLMESESAEERALGVYIFGLVDKASTAGQASRFFQ